MVRDCLGVREGEEVLVVANPATIGLGERFRGEAGRLGADGVLCLIGERAESGNEPPDSVAAAMAAADVVLCPTVQSLSHTAARRAATEAGVRVATLPGATEEMLARVMSADMEGLRRRKGEAIAAALTAGSRGADHLRRRLRPAARARRARGDRRRRRPDRAGGVRQPALRRGLHRPDRGHRRGHARRRRDDRLDRPGGRADRAHGRGAATWSRRPARRASGCSTCCGPTAASRAPTSPSSGSAPTRRPS